MEMMVHDALLLVKYVIFVVLKTILDNPINEMVIKPSQKLIEPIQSTIDEIPIPGLSVLFDLPGMLEEVVADIEQGAILALVSGTLGDVKSKLTTAAAEIGLAGLKL
jgi:hypothetical protein